jgi:hypothetical protein
MARQHVIGDDTVEALFLQRQRIVFEVFGQDAVQPGGGLFVRSAVGTFESGYVALGAHVLEHFAETASAAVNVQYGKCIGRDGLHDPQVNVVVVLAGELG